jgi:hypothetical protein
MPKSDFESIEDRKGSGYPPELITLGLITLSLRPKPNWSKRTFKKKVCRKSNNLLEKIRLNSKWGFMLCKLREKEKRGGVQCVKEENCVITDLPLFPLFLLL